MLMPRALIWPSSPAPATLSFKGFQPRSAAAMALGENDTSSPGRDTVRRLLLVLGLLALAMGLLWIGQGTGAIAWPRSSFMINQLQWAGYGAALSALGLVLIWQARR